jgi:chromosomal replication initiator protein
MNSYVFPGLHGYNRDKFIKTLDNSIINKDSIRIVEIICKYFDVGIYDLYSNSKKTPLVNARHWIMYILYKYKLLNLVESSKIVKRDHSTAIHAIKKIENQLSLYRDIVETKNELLKRLYND